MTVKVKISDSEGKKLVTEKVKISDSEGKN